MRLIDADKLPLDIEHEDIDDAPTIDAVEVVHCKDCIYFDPFRPTDGFCKISGMINTLEFFYADGRKEKSDG